MNNGIDTLTQIKATAIDLAIRFGPKVLTALIIMTVGVLVAGWVARKTAHGLHRLDLEPPVRVLFTRTARLLVVALFLVIALQNLGVELLPLIAGLGVAGAGIALAMQGVLGNVVAGLTIIFTRPFRVGEYISIIGVDGQVDAIDIFNTRLVHADRSIVVVPNRKIVGEILHNYGQLRQLNMTVSIGHASDLERALAAVQSAVAENTHALKDPAPAIGVSRLDSGAIVIAVGPWVNVADFAGTGGEINRAIVGKFAAAGIRYPMPPMEIRVKAGGHVTH